MRAEANNRMGPAHVAAKAAVAAGASSSLGARFIFVFVLCQRDLVGRHVMHHIASIARHDRTHRQAIDLEGSGESFSGLIW